MLNYKEIRKGKKLLRANDSMSEMSENEKCFILPAVVVIGSIMIGIMFLIAGVIL
jgi:hypothetical protein